MLWAQVTIICMQLLGLFLCAKDHGKPRKPENAWTALVAVVVSFTLTYLAGGFSKIFH